MVIQCSACDTRFKIADDKLKPGGVKVRCSKCSEIFTVMPPEAEAVVAKPVAAPEPAETETDWSDLSASFNDTDGNDDTDDNDGTTDSWSGLIDEAVAEESNNVDSSFDDFSFGDDEPADQPAEDSFTFGTESTPESEIGIDDFAFDSDSAADVDTGGGISEDAFSFGGQSSDDVPEESHGEGAQDIFSFDSDQSAAVDTSGAGRDDFNWDDSDSDSLSFDTPPDEGENLDFSSVSLQPETDTAEEKPAAQPAAPAPKATSEMNRPAGTKGPQKKAQGKKRPLKGRHTAKKKSPWGKLATLILLLALLLGGGFYGMQRMGFWSGDFAQLGSADYSGFAQTLWVRANAQIQALTGNSAAVEPVGSIAILEMSGRFVDSDSAGRLFVIDGKVRNDFQKPRSAIAIRGSLYNAAGKSVANQKVFCGNTLSAAELRSLPIEKILERGKNQFGDSLSNLDIAPKGTLPFTVVFAKIPKDIVEFNVEVVDSSSGSQP